MRSLRHCLAALLVAASVAVAPLALSPAVVQAAPTTSAFQIPLVWYTGIWICNGIIPMCAVNPVAITGEVPGTVRFPPVATSYPDGLYWIHWTNFSTATSGVATLDRTGLHSVVTGPGLVTASMTMGAELIAGTGAFWVP